MESAPAGSQPKNENTRIASIVLLIEVVLCCLILMGALGGYSLINYGTQRGEFSTATAQAQMDVTATSRAMEVANYKFFDDFKDNQHQWAVGGEHNEYWDGSISIQDGMYIWDVTKVKNPGSATWRSHADETPITDFDLSFNAKQARGRPGQLCYGVAFRVSPRGLDGGGYLFSACDNQQYSVDYYNSKDGWDQIVPWTATTAVRTKLWNNMAVSVRESHFVLSINDIIVSEFDVSEFDDGRRAKGQIYLVLHGFDKDPGTIWFDNFGIQPR